jgi:hypothetical protein
VSCVVAISGTRNQAHRRPIMEVVGAATHFDTATGGTQEPVSINTRPVISEQLVHIDLQDERIQDVIGRIIRVVKTEYPDAEFVSYIGTSPLGIYTEVYTPAYEFENILNILDDRLGDLHVAAGLNVVIVPKKKVASAAA